VPLHFRVESGNTTDDQTHRHTWDLLCKLVGRKDFLYVADCKLATRENMAYLAQDGGRFLTVLPRTRSEDAAFRQRLRECQVRWRPLWEKTDEDGQVRDHYAISDGPALTTEGYRLVWYHSTRKADLDAAARATQIEKTLQRLGQLRAKITSPRTRWRQADKIQRTVDQILETYDTADFVRVEIAPSSKRNSDRRNPAARAPTRSTCGR